MTPRASQLIWRRLAAGQPLEVLGVAGAVHRDLRRGAVDLAQVVGRELDCRGRRCSPPADAAWSCPGSARSTASAPAARRARSAPASPSSLRDPAEQVDEGLIGLARLRREPRQRCAEVGAVEVVFSSILPGEKAPAERAVRARSRCRAPRASAAPPLRAARTTASIRSAAAVTGCTACARRIVCAPASERPKCLTLPAGSVPSPRRPRPRSARPGRRGAGRTDRSRRSSAA